MPQWAVRIPIGRRVDLEARAMSLSEAMIRILTSARNSFLELAGGSRVFVSKAILIKCEPA